MVSLRKLFLIPTALVALAGIASAVTTVNCSVPTVVGSTGVLRVEGKTEALPTLVSTCTAPGVALAAGELLTINVFPTGGITFTGLGTTTPSAAVTAATIGFPILNIASTAGVAPIASQTAYTAVVVSPSTITFSVKLPVIATDNTFKLTFDNLLVDASGLASGGSAGVSISVADITGNLDSKIFGAGATASFNANAPNIALALKSLSVTSFHGATPAVVAAGPALTACSTDAPFNVTAVALAGNGKLFDNISFTPILPTALQATARVTFSVNNLPSGVKLYVPVHIDFGTLLSGKADLVAGYDANLAGGYLASVVGGTGTQYALLPPTGTAVYQITTAASSGADALTVPVIYTANGPVLAAAPVSISAGYAPTGTTPVPRFAAGSVIESNFITETPCASTLFFPYVVAGGGYDTGIAISSSGVFGDASKAASGQCVISFMGKGAPMTTKTLDVTVGQTNAFDIVGSMPTANFYGYAVAKCNFLNASGYAYVANSTGGTASYLPLMP